MLRMLFLAVLTTFPVFSGDKSADTSGCSVCGYITGYRPGITIYVSLYNSRENFAATKGTKGMHFWGDTLPSDSVRYCFRGVTPGEYMVAAFQDINGDRTLNTGRLGRPVEPYALYRPYRGMFAPSFDACRFPVNADIDNADIRF